MINRDNKQQIKIINNENNCQLPLYHSHTKTSPAIPHLSFADKLDNALWAAAHHILPAEHDCRDKTIFLGHKALLQVKCLLIPSQYFGANLKCLTEGQ